MNSLPLFTEDDLVADTDEDEIERRHVAPQIPLSHCCPGAPPSMIGTRKAPAFLSHSTPTSGVHSMTRTTSSSGTGVCNSTSTSNSSSSASHQQPRSRYPPTCLRLLPARSKRRGQWGMLVPL
jgi:hypothetical protein